MNNSPASDPRPRSFRWIEARDLNGQLYQLMVVSGHENDATTALSKIARIDRATSRTSFTGEGLQNYASRYPIHRHSYAGGHHGYLEVIEIGNAPDGRHPIVLHVYPEPRHRLFSEWASVDDAKRGYERFFSSGFDRTRVDDLPGFLRSVECGMLQPWFCAVGDEDLVGDYAIPHGLEDDPVFRLGAKFVCREFGEGTDIVHVVRTCLGTSRRIKGDFGAYERWVHWDDGSVTKLSERNNQPRPLRETEQWIEEAVDAFRSFLNGRTDRFEVPIGQGQSLVGKLKRASTSPTARGEYKIRVHLDHLTEPKEGWVAFTPTPEAPDLATHLTQKYAEKQCKMLKLEVLDTHLVRNGKKWCGVWVDETTEKLA